MASEGGDGGVGEDGVDAADAVDDLGDAEIDEEAGQGESLSPGEPVLFAHEVEHRVEGERHRLVQILVEPER